MGLDLRISEVQNSTTDELGRTVTTTVELTNLRGCYRISVNTFNRIIKVYEVGYVRENGETVPSYHAINTIDMGKSKFAKKVIAGSESLYA